MLRKCYLTYLFYLLYYYASMRPEHGCSGNGEDRGSLAVRYPGFNEAGARMLRK